MRTTSISQYIICVCINILYNNSIKTTLFNSYCGSMHTSNLWCYLKNQSLKGIAVAYNNSFRIIHNLSPSCSASHMFATNYVKSFNERIRSSIFSLLCRLEKSDNILFVNYLHTFIYYRSPLIKHWIDQCMLLILEVCTFIQIYFFILTYLIYIFYYTSCMYIYIYIFFSLHVPLLFIMCVYVFFLTCMFYNIMGSCLKKHYYYYYN